MADEFCIAVIAKGPKKGMRCGNRGSVRVIDDWKLCASHYNGGAYYLRYVNSSPTWFKDIVNSALKGRYEAAGA
ncbi:MAG TPA: hypothetical protein VIY48_07555 [Candidatus Paceibacterota bacterium]